MQQEQFSGLIIRLFIFIFLLRNDLQMQVAMNWPKEKDFT